MKKIVIIASFLAFSTSFLNAQSIKLVDAVALIGKDTVGVSAWAKSRDYQMIRSRVPDFLHFVHITSLGTQELDIAVKKRKVNAISWTEHLMYISILTGDATMLEGFNMKQQMNSKVLPFENVRLELSLNLIIQEEANQIKITIGRRQ